MIYGSVCSGIESATVAWHPLGWKPAFFSEIEPFPRALLRHHYPEVPLHGDFTTIEANQYGAINLLVGGTPCQDFSVAGLRRGLAGERGNLTLEFVWLVERYKPEWVVWENVPGVLSIDGGRAFGTFLHRLGKCGYGFAYRILDAQYFGVPQRRRRVFVVGYLGDWRPPAAVLFEREGLRRDITPRREARQSVAALTANGVGTCGADDNQGQAGHLIAHTLRAEGFDASEDGTGRGIPLVPHTAWALQERDYKGADSDTKVGHLIPVIPLQEVNKRTGISTTDPRAGIGIGKEGDPMFTLQAGAQHAVAFDTTQITSPHNRSNPRPGDPCHPLAAGAHAPAIAFTERGREQGRTFEVSKETAYCLTDPGGGGRAHSRQLMDSRMRVRRLTPRECERLQGFPDDYTLIPFNGKPAADSPRYRALGNSKAVPVVYWLGQRIEQVSRLIKENGYG